MSFSARMTPSAVPYAAVARLPVLQCVSTRTLPPVRPLARAATASSSARAPAAPIAWVREQHIGARSGDRCRGSAACQTPAAATPAVCSSGLVRFQRARASADLVCRHILVQRRLCRRDHRRCDRCAARAGLRRCGCCNRLEFDSRVGEVDRRGPAVAWGAGGRGIMVAPGPSGADTSCPARPRAAWPHRATPRPAPRSAVALD